MWKRLLKVGGVITAVAAFLNIVTSTWLNLVNLHVLPSVYAGQLNGSVVFALGLSTVISLFIAVAAFIFGGFYFFAVVVAHFANRWLNPSVKFSPLNIALSASGAYMVYLFRRFFGLDKDTSPSEPEGTAEIIRKARIRAEQMSKARTEQEEKPLIATLTQKDAK